jgi:hypothetical protein
MRKKEIFAASQPEVRPPDFLLPKAEGSATRRPGGIYVSWDGRVYGPTEAANILAGIKTSFFNQDAQFWFEGQANWQPLSTFTEAVGFSHEKPVTSSDPLASAPTTPPALPPRQPSGHRRKDRHRHSRSCNKNHRSRRDPVVVVGFLILAALLTVGLLSLLMFI